MASDGAAPIRVLLVEDHEMVAAGFVELLRDQSDLEVLRPVGTVVDAVRSAQTERPAVVLMDFNLPDGDGAEATRLILAADPEVAVVMVAADVDLSVLEASLAAGCTGFVSKWGRSADLQAAIRAAAAGEAYFTADVLRRLVELRRGDGARPNFALSAREVEVLQRVADGESTEGIALDLGLSVHTVRNHVRRILARLDAHSKLQAVVVAAREGLIQLNGS